ncbi:hypothetical protein L249_8283 [Ophiocordyceps polyrhachis-furcata BCC 54312]|uniref:DNA (cytosine-5-)-methyltransferase n=1 Tax=Ophiocordyceps polyrhachis-furcata BCC 54312 TaxID=1330021 RepID=A0A367LH78_9HYPO|nr:hypothetical protein L249_8283 [Ophiocordyceps polyrhachis-furcata BCC 54312]
MSVMELSSSRSRSISVASTATLRAFDTDTVPEAIDLTLEDSDGLQHGELALVRVVIRGQAFQQGNFVEVRNTKLGTHIVDFIQVKVVLKGPEGKRILRGTPFTRTRNLAGELPKKLNEICMLHYTNISAGLGAVMEPSLVSVAEDFIVGKRKMIVTNAPWPEFNPSSGDNQMRHGRHERLGLLVCRWNAKVGFVMKGRKMKPVERAMEMMRSTEVLDVRYRIQDWKLRNRWRGSYVQGGSFINGRQVDGCPVDLDADTAVTVPRTMATDQRYTFFDAYAGAGGVSRGAQSAGLKVSCAIDKDRDACRTYKLNFPTARLFEMSVDKFIQSASGEHIRSDVLHMSPPCQFFSPAHTRESVHDEANMDAFLGGGNLVHKIRPRIVTVEQTFGINHDRHQPFLRALIGHLTQLNYSVRWKVVHLCAWGCAQKRKRLIIIAAGPGERLPEFPQDTHSEAGGAGLLPFTCFGQAIAGIMPGDELHDVEGTRHFPVPRSPLDATKLVDTVTTGAGDLYHPSGRRELTIREYACLQGFPHCHRFRGTKTSKRCQIGNAFPPNTVEVLYRHLRLSLLRQDGLMGA